MDLEALETFDDKFIAEFKLAITKAMVIQRDKNKTYNGSNVSYKEYTSVPNFYFAQMWNKMLRIKSIVQGSEVNFESLEDSLVDLINYTGFYFAEIRLNKEQKDVSDTSK